MADTTIATNTPFISVFTDTAKNPYFAATVIAALAQIASQPIGQSLLNEISGANIAPHANGWKDRISRPPNRSVTIGTPGIEGGSRATGHDESPGHASPDIVNGATVNGAGTLGYCVWNPNIYNTPNGPRPAFIGLAHELIHCYHMVKGIKKQGYDDEEMFTVGLDPYMNAAITENRIRLEHNVPIRHNY